MWTNDVLEMNIGELSIFDILITPAELENQMNNKQYTAIALFVLAIVIGPYLALSVMDYALS